jgi:hypothetical protein
MKTLDMKIKQLQKKPLKRPEANLVSKGKKVKQL